MVVIPQRLFSDPQVQILLRQGNTCILLKELKKPVIEREGYISNHVISILLRGKQVIETYDRNQINVGEGEILFIPRGMYQVSDLLPGEGNFRSLLFYFDDDIVREFIANSSIYQFQRGHFPDHLKLGIIPTINQFAQSLTEIYRSQQLKDPSFLRLKILELLHLLHGLADTQAFANFLFQLSLPKKRNIKSFMEANYLKPLKIEDYANLTGRSLSSFRRDFHSFYATTPQKWLKQRRMEKALHILHDRKVSVTELAFEVGYENISYFIKAFKQHVGLSPKQYMMRQKG